MATDRFSALGELLPELAGSSGHEAAHEHGHEQAHEAHHEAEAHHFFGRLSQLVAAGRQSPALRRLALAAARSVIGGFESESESELELELEGELEVSPLARVFPDQAGRGGLDPQRRVYAAALMEHLAHAATEAATQGEAEAHVRRMVPIAAALRPQVAPVLMRTAPAVARGLTRVVRTIASNPQARPMLRAVPMIVQGTMARLARQAAASAVGRAPVPTARTAVRVLAGQAARVLGSPAASVGAWRRGRSLDRYYHRMARRRVRYPYRRGPAAPGSPTYGPGGRPAFLPGRTLSGGGGSPVRAVGGGGMAVGPAPRPWSGPGSGPGASAATVRCPRCGNVFAGARRRGCGCGGCGCGGCGCGCR